MSALEPLSQLLVQIQSGDNAVRSAAELRLNQDWLDAGGDRPAQLLVGLAQLATAGEPAQRPSAAVILRRCATRVSMDSPQLARVVDQIGDAARTEVRQLVLQGMLAPEQASFTRHKLGDAVAELARPPATGPHNGTWSGLVETVAQAASESPDASVRETAFRVLGAAPELVEEREDMISGAVQLLMRGFEDPSEAVRTTATTAFAAFFAYLPKSTWGLFKPLLPALLNVMEPLRQSHKEEELTSVLESLVTLAEIAPRMFAPVFPTLIDFTMAIAGDTDFDEPPRMTALELMAAFAEEAPNMCRNETKYVQQFVPQLLKMLTEIGVDDDNAAEWSAIDDNEIVEEEEPIHREAKLAIDRISLSLGGDLITPILFKYLPLMFSSEAWRERVAGLMALSNAAEGCREEMLPSLDAILHAVQPLLMDAHPRVQWSACNAMGQLSTDLAPQVQESYGPLILPGLVAKLGAESTWKVQAHAAAALVNFSDAAEKEVMDPFLDDLLSRLLLLVQSPKRYVQEQALTTIAIVADSSQKLFTKYYDTLMPLVLNILKADVPNEYRLLKAKAIECSTLIALAVGREKFAPHMNELGEVLVAIQQQSPDGFIRTETGEEEDPCHAYLVQSWGRLCRVIGPDFAPYLPIVMPPLLLSAKSQADCHILDVDQAESLRDAEGWEVIKYAGQWLGIHTALFEEKANAIELLQVYPRELGGAFWSYVPEVLNEVVHPGIKFYYNQRVRAFSCQLIPPLIVCAQQHFSAEADVQAMWQPLLQVLLTGVLRNDREVPGMFAEAYTTISRVLDVMGRVALAGSDIELLCASLVKSLSATRERVEARGHEKAAKPAAPSNDDWDEYEESDDEEDEEASEDEELLDAANRLLHSLLKAYGTDLLQAQACAALLQLLPQFCASPAQDAQLWALEALGDFAEFGKAAAAPALQAPAQFVATTLANYAQVAPLVRANAANCMGRLALFCPDFAQLALASLEPLYALAHVPEARNEENVEATERSCGAIARILRTHGTTALPADQFALAVSEWIKTLPITAEPDGASFSYLFLAELLEKKHASALNNFDIAFRAVANALTAQTLAGKPAEFTVTNTKAVLLSLPQERQMELFGMLDNAEKQVVQQVFT